MAYERKTIDTWELQLNYGYGWGNTFAEITKKVLSGIHIDRVHKRRGKGETERVQRESASVPSKTC